VTSLSEGMTLLGEKDYDTRGREEVDDVTGGDVTRRVGGGAEDIPAAGNYVAENYVAGNYIAEICITMKTWHAMAAQRDPPSGAVRRRRRSLPPPPDAIHRSPPLSDAVPTAYTIHTMYTFY